MKDPKIAAYLEANKDKYSPDVLKGALLKAGYLADDIDETIGSFSEVPKWKRVAKFVAGAIAGFILFVLEWYFITIGLGDFLLSMGYWRLGSYLGPFLVIAGIVLVLDLMLIRKTLGSGWFSRGATLGIFVPPILAAILLFLLFGF